MLYLVNKIDKNSSGFTILEIIFVLDIIFVISTVGLLTYKHVHMNTNLKTPPVYVNVNSGINGYTYVYTKGGAAQRPPAGESSPLTPQPSTSFAIKDSNTQKIVSNATSNSSGYFSIKLKPGTYILIPKSIKDETAEQKTVTVNADNYTSINIEYSSTVSSSIP